MHGSCELLLRIIRDADDASARGVASTTYVNTLQPDVPHELTKLSKATQRQCI